MGVKFMKKYMWRANNNVIYEVYFKINCENRDFSSYLFIWYTNGIVLGNNVLYVYYIIFIISVFIYLFLFCSLNTYSGEHE